MIYVSDATSLLDYLSKAGVVTLLIVIVYGGYKRWWVFGWQYKDLQEQFKEMVREKNSWRETALKGFNIATDAFKEVSGRND